MRNKRSHTGWGCVRRAPRFQHRGEPLRRRGCVRMGKQLKKKKGKQPIPSQAPLLLPIIVTWDIIATGSEPGLLLCLPGVF